MTDKPWSVRIPAMIATGEGWFRQPGIIDAAVFVNEKGEAVYVTAGEVALAKLGWEMWVEYCESLEHEEPGDAPPPALIAYCKKVEAL